MRSAKFFSSVLLLFAVSACSESGDPLMGPQFSAVGKGSLNTASTGPKSSAKAPQNVIFEDDFDGNVQTFNGIPNGWEVTFGSVDICGYASRFDFIPGNKAYLDMDGQTGQAGTIKRSVMLEPGEYTLSYDVAGSTRALSPEDTLFVSAGSYQETIVLNYFTPITRHTGTFSVTEPTTVDIVIGATGNDNMGPLLMYVLLVRTP